MKKIIALVMMCSLLLMSVSIGAESAAAGPLAVELAAGSVTVYDFDGIRLHAYASGDPLADECYALESDEGVVLLESTAFTANNEAWRAYVDTLGKPLAGAIMAYHPNGSDTEGLDIYATENALANWGEGGNIRALTDSFTAAFGDALEASLPAEAKIVSMGDTLTLAGMDFIIREEGDDAFGVEIPAINSVYLHMMGSDVHNVLTSAGHIDAFIAELESFRYALVLTGHYAPEGEEAVRTKISYLNTVKELAASSADADAFIQAMNTAFPDYSGANYLDMTAGFLFPAAQ